MHNNTLTVLSAAAALALAAGSAFANEGRVGSGSAFDLVGPTGTVNLDRFANDILFDDLEDLTPQDDFGTVVSDAGVTYASFDGDIVSDGGDIELFQENTFADDFFFDEVSADYSLTVTPAASNGFIVSVDYDLSDLDTDRFYRYTSAGGTFFSVIGDSDGDGDFDVLETENGAGVFRDTGVAIPLSGNIALQVEGGTQTVLLNEMPIFTGSVIGADDPNDAIIAPEFSTGILFSSGNNAGGLGSTQMLDNLAISTIPEPATAGLLAAAGLGLLRRRRA